MLASRVLPCAFRPACKQHTNAAISRRARVTVRSGEGDRELESAFEKELRRRGMDSGSSSDDADTTKTQRQRTGPRPPPSFQGADDEVPPQLAKSRALNSEGLEGLIPRATELAKLGGLFFLAFVPFIAAVSIAFAAIYFVMGDTFVHGGSPTAGPPPYYDPDVLLAAPTADPMVPLDLR